MRSLAVGLAVVIPLVVLQVLAAADHAERGEATRRSFTVADSIGMTQLVDPDVAMAQYVPPEFKRSPDGRSFVIVTRRGNLATGQNDYALILFEASAILAFLGEPDDARRPEGRVLLRLSSSSNDRPIDELRWLADNRTLAFIGHFDGSQTQVYSIDIVSGDIRQLTYHPRPVEAFGLSADADRMIFVSTVPDYPEGHGKNSYVVGTRNMYETMYVDEELPVSRYQYYTTLKGSDVPATALGGSFNSQFPGTWQSPDGRWAIGIQSPERVPSHWPDSYVPFARHWYFREIAETFDEETMTAQDIIFQFVLIDTVDGSVAPVFDAPTGAFFAGSKLDARWLPDSSSVVLANTFLPLDVRDVAERKRREQAPFVVEFEPRSKRLRPIARLDGRFEEMTLTSGGAVCVRQQPPGSSVRTCYRRRGDSWRILRTVPGKSVPAGRDNNRLDLSIRQDMNTSPDIQARDSHTGRAKLITDLNPQFRDLTLGTVESFEWSDSKGRSWLGGIIYPPDFRRDERYPLVIQTYGFHPDQFLLDGPLLAFSSVFAARALANRGMLVLQMPLPSQARSGPPVADGRPEEIEAATLAIESVIDQLDALELIDRQRVGLIGFSRTGLHLQNLITFSEYDFAAATIADSFHISLLDYLAKFGAPNPGMLEMERLIDAKPWGKELNRWVERNPVLHLDRVRTPLRLEHYRSRGLFGWWDTYAILKRLHRPVELVHFPNGAHNLVKPLQRLVSLQGNVDWFAFWLKDEENPDPAKAEQYARWRKLREQRDAQLAHDYGSPPEVRLTAEKAPSSSPAVSRN